MAKLNELRSAALGSLNTVTPVCIKKAITADATAGLSITVPFAFEITNVVAHSDATVGSATAKLTDGTHDITAVMDIATLDAVVYGAVIDMTYKNVDKNGTLKVVTNGANDRGTLYIYGVRR